MDACLEVPLACFRTTAGPVPLTHTHSSCVILWFSTTWHIFHNYKRFHSHTQGTALESPVVGVCSSAKADRKEMAYNCDSSPWALQIFPLSSCQFIFVSLSLVFAWFIKKNLCPVSGKQEYEFHKYDILYNSSKTKREKEEEENEWSAEERRKEGTISVKPPRSSSDFGFLVNCS